MNHGVLVADAPVKSILQQGAGASRQVVAEIEGPDVSSQLHELAGVDGVTAEEADPGRTRYVLLVSGAEDPRPRVFSLAAENSWVLWELRVEAPRLEEVFRSLTQDG